MDVTEIAFCLEMWKFDKESFNSSLTIFLFITMQSDLGVKMSAAQSSWSVEEVWAHAAMAKEDKKLATENWRETIRVSCPECNAPLATNAKFCPECIAKLKFDAHCTECGAKLHPDAKFYGDYSAKTS